MMLRVSMVSKEYRLMKINPEQDQEAFPGLINQVTYGYSVGGEGFYTGGSGKLNDLWKYNPVTNQWTWIKGSTIVKMFLVFMAQ